MKILTVILVFICDIFIILYEFWIKLKFSSIAVLRIFGVTINYGRCYLSQDF